MILSNHSFWKIAFCLPPEERKIYEKMNKFKDIFEENYIFLLEMAFIWHGNKVLFKAFTYKSIKTLKSSLPMTAVENYRYTAVNGLQ